MHNIKVLQETADWVAVIKPHGLHVLPDRYDETIPTLQRVLEKEFGRLYVVHRLDSGTGGVMIFAKTKSFHSYMNTLMEEGRTEKRYLAIVKGAMPEAVTVMLPISKRNQKGRYKINFKSGRRAVTSFYPKVVSERASLVEAQLHTGRTHQIRVHLRAHGHPLEQDFLYNERIDDRRLTLFAKSLDFIDERGTPVHLEAELSDFMRDRLRYYELLEKDP
ncbi:RluA family pseudouridine synthase [Limisalsivibrio acetivorans]|uniref:RluA family pseudouridine synthase n=1 Tax=Limisalsivibrio acetivorans TaxID=1304888 RepID=UPI0003B49127|nr:RNA pseudouridine synthase [Limisalsivibrio acetivorans]